MLDVAMILMSSHLTGYLRNGTEPKPSGNRHAHATNSCYQAKDGLVMLGASNLRQQHRLWLALERPDMVKEDNEARDADRDREAALLADILKTRTADEWEAFFQARHVPAARVRQLAEAVLDPQFEIRGGTHRHQSAPGVEGGFSVPLAAFKFAHGGPSIETPPPQFGADTDAVLTELGYTQSEITAFRSERVI
jgi:crotonobetainyl-CoA:carnitine CoA-transferase CaiB-like acyl-CoA transferase